MSCFCHLLDCQTLKIRTQKKKYAQGKERYVKNGMLPMKRKTFQIKATHLTIIRRVLNPHCYFVYDYLTQILYTLSYGAQASVCVK